jgi:hypothetical protein
VVLENYFSLCFNFFPTGCRLGDNTSMRITQYELLVSSCIKPLAIQNCSAWRDQVFPTKDNFSITEFRYPVSYTIMFDLSEGYVYYFHVTPHNVLGPSQSPEIIWQQFGKIHGAPAFDYMSGTEASVVASRGKLHVWMNADISEVIKIRIVNIPVVRDNDVMSITFSVGNWSFSDAANVTSSYIRYGTTILFRPPYLPESIFYSCKSITVTVLVSFKISFFEVGSLPYYLTYSCYPKPLLSSVVPTRGSVGGGNILALNVIDTPGAITRQGANLPNFQDVFAQQRSMQILFSASSQNYTVQATILSIVSSTDSSRSFRISVRTPVVDIPDVSRIIFVVDSEPMAMDTSVAEPFFEFVGSKILSVTPSSGSLNPGSGGMDLTLKVSNLFQSENNINVTIGGSNCKSVGLMPTLLNSAVGTETSFTCRAPELPLNQNGSIEIQIILPRKLDRVKTFIWLYSLPPPLFIDINTVVINERTGPPLWTASGSSAQISFLVRNVGVFFGKIVRDVRLLEAELGLINFLALDQDLRLTVTVLVSGPARDSAMLSLLVDTETSVKYFIRSFIPGFSLEIRDISQPRILTIAPAEVPAGQTSVFLMVVEFANALLAAPTTSVNCSLLWSTESISAQLYGVVSLENWLKGDGQILTIFPKSRLISLMTGVSDDILSQIQAATASIRYADTKNTSSNIAITVGEIPAFNFAAANSGTESAVTAKLTLSFGKKIVSSQISLAIDPVLSSATVFAQTENNNLRSGLSGNIQLSISLENFAVVRKGSEIVVNFDTIRVPVYRLLQSNSNGSVIIVIVPPSATSKVTTVTVAPSRLPLNIASFSLEYYDDRIPIISGFSPYQVYASPGGTPVQVLLSNFPEVPLSSVYVRVQVTSTLLPDVPAVTYTYVGDKSAITFLTPSSDIAGGAIFSILIQSSGITTAPVKFEMAPAPSTKAAVLRITPSSGLHSGGFRITVILTNMMMVSEGSVIMSNTTLKGLSLVQLCNVPATSITQTAITFTASAFPFGGSAAVEIWQVGRKEQSVIFPFLYIDDNQPALNYIYPSTGIPGQSTAVKVSISRFGFAADLSQYSLSSSSDFQNGTVLGVIENKDGSTVLSLSLFCSISTFNVENFTLKHCPGLGRCLFVELPFGLNEVYAPSVTFFTPMSITTDGRVPITVDLSNFPVDVKTPQMHVRLENPSGDFILNASVSDLRMNTKRGDLSDVSFIFIAPEANRWNPAQGLIATVIWVNTVSLQVGRAIFPSPISYSKPSDISIDSVIPMKAATDVESLLIITLRNFPGVSQILDIAVEFSSTNAGIRVAGSVVSFSRLEASLYQYAVQDISVSVLTPVGNNVAEGLWRLTAYHHSYYERVAVFDGFQFVNSVSPQTQGMTSETGQHGVNSLSVRQSRKTSVTVVIGEVSSAPIKAIIGSSGIDLMHSDIDASSKIATAIFNTPPNKCQVPCSPVFGLILFSGGCSKCVDASCCKSGTCLKACGDSCLSACFSLNYIDDLLPSVLFQSNFQGPSFGGTVIRFKISNFPMIKSNWEVTTHFLSSKIEGSVFVSTSSETVTELTVVTPAVDMDRATSLTYDQNLLFAFSRPDMIVTFPFTFNLAVPVVQSVSPSFGTRNGNVLVTVIIAGFPYPGDIGVQFGTSTLEDSFVSILPGSSALSTAIAITTQRSLTPEIVVCRVYPKSCPVTCGQAVTFNFQQIDPVEILPPFPSRTFVMDTAPMITVRLKAFPVQGTVVVNFLGSDNNGIIFFFPSIVQPSESGLIKTVTFVTPNQVGVYVCNLIVQDQGLNTTLHFSHEIYDGNQVRVISVQPSQVPIQTQLYGQTVSPRIAISVVIRNFPQGLSKSMVLIYFGSGLYGEVASIEEVSTCETFGENCNITKISVISPSVDVPRILTGQVLTPSVSETTLKFSLKYFATCDFSKFCAGISMIPDAKLMLPSTSPGSDCDVQYCVDPANLPDPELISFFPSEGPASGGTSVIVIVRNLLITSKQAVLIRVDVGARQVLLRPSSIAQDPGGSLRSSTSTLTLETARISSGMTSSPSIVQYIVTSSFGPLSKQISFQYQYTPVISDSPIVVSVFPTSVQTAVATAVSVQLQNFPLVTPATAFRIMSKLACSRSDLIRATGIVSSTYSSTIATIVFNISITGNCPVKIFWEDLGELQASIFNISFAPPPDPTVQSWFPQRGVRGKTVTLQVLNFNLLLKMDDLQISLVDSSIPVEVSSVTYSGSLSCTRASCSRFAVTFVVPNLTDDGISKNYLLAISAGGQSVLFSLPVDSQLAPSIRSIQPTTVVVTETNRTDIVFYITNAATFCSSASLLTVIFGARKGSVRSSVIQLGLCVVTVRAPLITDDSELSCTLSNSVIALEFCSSTAAVRLLIAPAPIQLQPIDSMCSGGTVIRFTLVGTKVSVVDASEIRVVFGGKPGGNVKILSTVARNGLEALKVFEFSVIAPEFDMASALIEGNIFLGGTKIAFPFLFECIASPTASVSPSQATLSGLTAAGFRSTVVTLYNFPALATAQDVAVVFGGEICDGQRCGVLSFQNLANSVILTVSIPAWGSQASVSLSVTFRGKAAPPAGGDSKSMYVRVDRTVSVPFRFAIPAPVVISIRFCKNCNPGFFCIVRALCAWHQAPVSDSVAISGAGVLTIVVDNMPQIPYNATSGLVQSPATVSLRLGKVFASIRRILVSDGLRLSFEAQLLGAALEAGRVSAQLSVQPNTALQLVTVAVFSIRFFNDQIEFLCISTCQGSSVGGQPFLTSVSNFPLTSQDLSESVTVQFDSIQAARVDLVNSTDDVTFLLITPPSYDCFDCQFSRGFAVASLHLLYTVDLIDIAVTAFTFWAPPSIRAATFDSSGTRIVLAFDQATDRAGMDVHDYCCESLLQDAKVLLGDDARCVWTDSKRLDIFTGRKASVIPGTNLHILPSARLLSLNGLSMPSESSLVVTAPVRVPPVAIVKCVDVIDTCSALEIFATVASPRPLVRYLWKCLNDADFDGYLGTVAGPAVSLSAGTPELKTIDKSYLIAFSATDFLGSTTSQVVVKVYKQAAPAPQIQFSPPYLSITRDQPVLVRGHAVFSKCPVDQGQLGFSWRLISGPKNFPATALEAVIPQIYVAPGTLTAGSTYVLGLQVANVGDSSQVSEGRFVLQVGYQLLVASIEGGSSLMVSFSSGITLSAAKSFDPDMTGSSFMHDANQSISFLWDCTITEDSISTQCRDKRGATLYMPQESRIAMPGDLLAPMDTPYVFTVTVSKPGKAPSAASMPVYVVADQRPTIAITSACVRADFDQRACCISAGTLVANVGSRLTFKGSSYLANTTFEWALLPPNRQLDQVTAPLGKNSSVFVLLGSATVFVPGNVYAVELLGYGIEISVPGQVKQALVINSPPVGGSFSACLVPSDGSAIDKCISTGFAVVDSFLLSCSSWTDPEGDPLLQYRFGYYLGAANSSSVSYPTRLVWFDWAADSVKEMSFPSGHVTVIAQVRDDCGAFSEVLQSDLLVSGNVGRGRRHLAASDFWGKAHAKVLGAIQTFRPDQVNQLLNSIAVELQQFSSGPSDIVVLLDSLILALRAAVDQVLFKLLCAYCNMLAFIVE